MGHAARSWWSASKREGQRRGAPCGADKLGDAVGPILVEVIDGAVAQELGHHAQSGLRDHRSATSVG